jgi:hypothetical protein
MRGYIEVSHLREGDGAGLCFRCICLRQRTLLGGPFGLLGILRCVETVSWPVWSGKHLGAQFFPGEFVTPPPDADPF